MRNAIMVAALLAMASGASAQGAPDLKGTWSGQWKTVIYGNNPHHEGSQTTADAPRVRDIEFTIDVQGQEGTVLWGQTWSDPSRKEPFAATITHDGKIVGADTDGALTGSITGNDELAMCYTHTAASPSQSIVASCGTIIRAR